MAAKIKSNYRKIGWSSHKKETLFSRLRYKPQKEILDLPVNICKKNEDLRLYPSYKTIQTSMPEWPTLPHMLLKDIGTVLKWVIDYIQDISWLLSQIIAYREKASNHICKFTANFYFSYFYLEVHSKVWDNFW